MLVLDPGLEPGTSWFRARRSTFKLVQTGSGGSDRTNIARLQRPAGYPYPTPEYRLSIVHLEHPQIGWCSRIRTCRILINSEARPPSSACTNIGAGDVGRLSCCPAAAPSLTRIIQAGACPSWRRRGGGVRRCMQHLHPDDPPVRSVMVQQDGFEPPTPAPSTQRSTS